jgi:hypothetical protein
MFSRTSTKRSRNDDEEKSENEESLECPICYEKLDNNNTNEIVFTCSNCKKKFGLNCILKSCQCFWNRNENCKCPLCRNEFNDSDNSLLKEIKEIEDKIDRLWKRYQDNIAYGIQNSYSMGDSDISNIEDSTTLREIMKAQDEKARLIHIISTKNFIPDFENPLGRRGGKRYKKNKTKKLKSKRNKKN